MSQEFIATAEDDILFGAEPDRTELSDDTTFAIEPEADKRNAIAIRDNLAKVESSLTEFDKISAGLAALYEKYPVDLVYDVTTTAGMAEAIAHRAAYRDPRITVEKYRKTAKAPIVAVGRDIDSRAAWITAKLRQGEEPVHQQIKAEEDRRAKIKADKEAAEFGRVQAITEAIAEISLDAQIACAKPSAFISEALAKLRDTPLDVKVYQEMMSSAVAARDAAIAKLEVALKAKQWDEAQEAERIERERVRLAKQAEEDAERARVAAEQAAERARLAEVAAEQKRAAEAFAAEQAERVAAMAAQQAELDRLRAELEAAKHPPAPAAVVLDFTPSAEPEPAPVNALTPPTAESVAPVAQAETPTLALGDIKDRIAPLSITAEGLAQLGFEHSATKGASKLYRESQWPAMRAAMASVLVA